MRTLEEQKSMLELLQEEGEEPSMEKELESRNPFLAKRDRQFRADGHAQ